MTWHSYISIVTCGALLMTLFESCQIKSFYKAPEEGEGYALEVNERREIVSTEFHRPGQEQIYQLEFSHI